MFVYNDCRRDARVLREAATLTAAGHSVTVMARPADAASATGDLDTVDGIEIRRVPLSAGRRTAWQWFSAPWRLIRPWSRALRASVVRWPGALPRTLWLLLAGVASLPWLGLRAAVHVLAGTHPGRRSSVEWLARWQIIVLGWASAAAAAAPPADAWHAADREGLAAAGGGRRRAGGRLVYDSHEIFLEAASAATLARPAKWLLARGERRWARAADAVVTVNPSIANELARRLRPTRLVVVHNCPARWTPEPGAADLLGTAAQVPAGAPLLLYHGVFARHRGLEQLALASLEPGLERAHVVYLGYGSGRSWLEALALDARFDGRLHVLDAVDPAVLLDWVAGADVEVIPGQPSTLNHRLSSPNKLFEALAAGVPVAVMDFPYVRGLVLDDPDGPLGAVCDPTDPAAIAVAIRSIIELAPDARADLRRRCLQAAHERWNWETEAAKLVDLYASLAAGPDASGHAA